MAFLSFILLALVLPYQALGSDAPGFAITNGLCSLAVTPHGYPCQEFEVTTDDGYILSVQRIPQGLTGGGGAASRIPVLLQHGLFVDGVTWLLNSPQQNLPMILADNGYDVWISNLRGTRFSRKHVTLDPSSWQFWDWSWDQLAEHDLSSVIDFVFRQTGQKLHYIGHSMGTTIALALFSERKQVDKVQSATLLSPVAFGSHMNLPTVLGAFGGQADALLASGVYEYNMRLPGGAQFSGAVCAANPLLNCYDFMSAVTGPNCCLDRSTFYSYMANEPQSTSIRNVIHFSQTIRSGVFMKYDYGLSNFQVYGSIRPPLYYLPNIPNDLPLFLSYGANDLLADVIDVDILLNILRGSHNPDKLRTQYIPQYAHVDFIMGNNANVVVYNQIIDFIRNNS